MKKILTIILIIVLSACGSKQENTSDIKNIKLLVTSDTHGKFINFDYALNEEENSGSLAQVSTAIKRLKDDNTIVIDAGDFAQGNYNEIFIDDENHPMIDSMNKIGYDIQITGNHEYNYNVDRLIKLMSKSNAKVLTGNVLDLSGKNIFDSYTIVEKDGVKIGIIGMVTPNIAYWDSSNLNGYTVLDPGEEINKIIDEIEDSCDVLVAVVHMGEENEYGVKNSGAKDLANYCPKLDVIIAAHEHNLVENLFVNDILIVENKDQAKTLQEINITVKKDGDKYSVIDKKSIAYNMKDEAVDEEIIKLTKDADIKAKDKSTTIIGKLVNGPLVLENEIKGIPRALIEETKLINLVNNVMLYYSNADISAVSLFNEKANMQNGDIRNYDVAKVYKYINTLYKLKINGKQLKKYMEWSANFYNTYQDGDLIITFNPDIQIYNYDMFTGIKYDIDISKEPGNRIKNLRKMDDTPIKDDDEFLIAVNNYRANSNLLKPGSIFEEGEELPILIDKDIRGDIGGIRELIADYIKNVNKGVLVAPEITGNWKIIGNNWNIDDHNKAAELINNGKISITSDNNDTSLKIKTVTKKDIEEVK